MKNFFSILFVTVILFASCTTSREISISENKYEGMEIYTSPMVDREYREIEIIQVKAGWLAGPKTQMNRLVRQAKKAGANGLINVKYEKLGEGKKLTGTAVEFL